MLRIEEDSTGTGPHMGMKPSKSAHRVPQASLVGLANQTAVGPVLGLIWVNANPCG